MEGCAHCNSQFKRKTGGYRRFSLENDLQCDESAREMLEKITGVIFTPPENKRKGHFLCPSCWSILNAVAKYRLAIDEFWSKSSSISYIGRKRSLAQLNGVANVNEGKIPSETEGASEHISKKPRLSTPNPKTVPKSPSPSPKRKHYYTKFEPIVTAIRAHQYARAVRGMWHSSKGFKRQFRYEVTKIIRQEISKLLKEESNFPLCQKATMQNVKEFSWGLTLSAVEDKAPLLFSALKGTVTTGKTMDTLESNRGVKLKPIIGTALSCLLRGRAPHKAVFIPTMNSVQLWKGGLKRETLKQMSLSGICMGYDTTLAAVDRLGNGLDDAEQSCEQSLEFTEQTQNVDTTIPHEQSMDLLLAMSETESNIEEEEENETSSSEEEDNDIPP